MTEEMTKEVAKALAVKVEKATLIDIISALIDNDDYCNNITTFCISKCLGRKTLSLSDFDVNKVIDYANTHYNNNFSSLIEGSVVLLKVNPVERKLCIGYSYTRKEDETDDRVYDTTDWISAEYYDVLKEKK